MATATRQIEQIVRRMQAEVLDDSRRDPAAPGAGSTRENPTRSVKRPGLRGSFDDDVHLQARDSIEATGQIEEELEEEELDARAEEEEDEEIEARVEDDEDEEIEARGEEDEDEDLEARVEDDEGEEIEARGEEEDEELEVRVADDEDEDEELGARAEDEAGEEQPRAATKSQADKVIAVAKQQVGFREGKNNHTKFAAELIKVKIAQRWWQNQPWCQ